MASVQKFTRHDAINILRHAERSIQNSSNHDIDKSRTELNYSLLHRDVSDREYYLQRLHEVHCHNRADVKTLCSWIVTAPHDLAEADQERFFQAVADFVGDRYGKDNLCSAWVHLDEVTPHAHLSIIPVTYDETNEYEKVCASDVITRYDLSTFHPKLQAYLDDLGIKATVLSGITREQGGNRTVEELKRDRKRERTLEHTPTGRDLNPSGQNPESGLATHSNRESDDRTAPPTEPTRNPLRDISENSAEVTPYVQLRAEEDIWVPASGREELTYFPAPSKQDSVWDISDDSGEVTSPSQAQEIGDVWGTKSENSPDRRTQHERGYDLLDDWLGR